MNEDDMNLSISTETPGENGKVVVVEIQDEAPAIEPDLASISDPAEVEIAEEKFVVKEKPSFFKRLQFWKQKKGDGPELQPKTAASPALVEAGNPEGYRNSDGSYANIEETPQPVIPIDVLKSIIQEELGLYQQKVTGMIDSKLARFDREKSSTSKDPADVIVRDYILSKSEIIRLRLTALRNLETSALKKSTGSLPERVADLDVINAYLDKTERMVKEVANFSKQTSTGLGQSNEGDLRGSELRDEIQTLKNELERQSKKIAQASSSAARGLKVWQLALVIVLIFLVGGVNYFLPRSGSKGDMYIYLADLYQANAKSTDALQLVEIGSGLGVSTPDGWARIAAIYGQNKKFDKAIAAYQKAIQLAGRNPDLKFALASLYQTAGYSKNAEQEYQTIVDNHPDRQSSAYLELGKLYSRNKNYDMAVSAFQKASQLGASTLESNLGIGEVYWGQKQYTQALPFYQKVTQIDPNNFTAHIRLGDIYQNSDQCPKAEGEYVTASQINPDVHWSYLGLGSCYLSEQRYDEAIQEFTTAVEKQPQIESYIGLGQAYQAKKQCDKATEYFNKALGFDKTNQTAKDGISQCQG